jgi:antitoxin Phd
MAVFWRGPILRASSTLSIKLISISVHVMPEWLLVYLTPEELIDDTLEKGPQVVTRRGIDIAVVVSIDEWRKLKDENRLTWKDVLLGEDPRFELPLPKSGTVKSRKPAVFD